MIDLRLSDAQREIQDGAIAMLQTLAPPATAPDPHRALADWGWFALAVPEAQGGAGLGAAEEALLFLQAGKIPLPPGILATSLAARLAPAPLRADLLDGGVRAALALVSPGAAYCLDRLDARLLVAIGPEGTRLFPASAFTGRPANPLDESLALETGQLDASAELAREPWDRAVLLVAAELAGNAAASCHLAVEYAKIREQFGQPIGAFQAVKHRCASMAVSAYAAEAQLLMAAASAGHGGEDAAFQIAAAASAASTAARANAAAAIQLQGGMGFTAACPAHLYLKRAHLLSQLIGGAPGLHAWLLSRPAPANG